MTLQDWNSGFQSVAVFLNGDAIPAPNARGERVVDDTFLLCFNAHAEPVEFVTPDASYATEWTGELDTAQPTGSTDLVLKTGETLPLAGRSVVILRKTA
jgi:isoamylase